MANAMREVTVEQGLDPREMALAPFGGAGPLMATLLADELQMIRIIIPPLAGNFSAWGLLGADMVQSAARTRIMDLGDANLAIAGTVLAELFADIGRRGEHLRREAEHSARLDLRYKGQDHWLSIDLPIDGERIAADAAAVSTAFIADYQRTFGGTLSEVIEIVAVRATVRVPLPRRRQVLRETGGASAGTADGVTFDAYSFRAGRRLPFQVIARKRIAGLLDGPAIVTESTATLYLDAGWSAAAGAHGELVVSRTEVH
jgi:N-methylhydantoinase A